MMEHRDVFIHQKHCSQRATQREVLEGGRVDMWNRKQQWPRRVQPGDYIISVNGVAAWEDFSRLADAFANEGRDAAIRFTVQRSPQGVLPNPMATAGRVWGRAVGWAVGRSGGRLGVMCVCASICLPLAFSSL